MKADSEQKQSETTYVDAQYIKDDALESREYQTQLVKASLSESTLVALPTGTGKTAVALRIAAQRLEETDGRIMLLAPTQPLVNQQAAFFKDMLNIPDSEIKVFTGDIDPNERVEIWNSPVSILIATPQVIENDLIGSRYDLGDVSHLIFDECHRATGDYAYNYIGERYHGNANNKLVTGLSASPGSSKDEILDVSENLGITNIEVLTEEDDVLSDYLYETEIDYKWVDVPEPILEARDLVQDVFKEKLVKLKQMGVLTSARRDLSVSKLMQARGKIQHLIDKGKTKGYKAQSQHAEAMKLSHGWRTIETQSADTAVQYFEKIFDEAESSDGSKAAQRIASNPKIQEALSQLKDYSDLHPKLSELRVEVGRTLIDDGQVLIFTESRETVSRIVEFLDEGDINPVRFVGQSDKKNNQGMSQSEQKETLEAFRNGEHNVLVSTSVGEEGIDIPAVDLVMFYEPVPNAIRSVQRRGRTGRQTEGRVVVLIAKDTSDESAYYISQNREDEMKEELNKLRDMEDELRKELQQKQSNLSVFGNRQTDEDQPTVVIDSRETKSSIGQRLDRMNGLQLELETLDVADYVVSDRVGIERKELDDFLTSLTDGKRNLFDQIEELTEAYNRPVLIIEGGNGLESLYGRSGVNEKAVRSSVQSIAVDFNVSVLFTQTEQETAKNIKSLARREQEDKDRSVSLHGSKSTDTMAETQEYIVSSIPTIGPVSAEKLLEEFGTIEGIITADSDELTDVEGIGDKTAGKIQNIVTTDYTNNK